MDIKGMSKTQFELLVELEESNMSILYLELLDKYVVSTERTRVVNRKTVAVLERQHFLDRHMGGRHFDVLTITLRGKEAINQYRELHDAL